MSITAGTPTRSIRTAPGADGELLLVGGASHVVGRAESPRARVENLLSWTRGWSPDARLVARWSTQDYHPVDELPYVGPLLPRDARVLVATGYAKWGMANAVAAAHLIAGHIGDDRPEWGEAYRSWSRHEVTGLTEAVRLNAGVAAQLAGGYARAIAHPEPRTEGRRGRPRPRHPTVRPMPGPASSLPRAPAASSGAACIRWRSPPSTVSPGPSPASARTWAVCCAGTTRSARGTARSTPPASRRRASCSRDRRPGGCNLDDP